MELLNEMKLTVKSRNGNEAFVRNSVCAFCSELNPTVSETEDIKTAVSEAYTNCVVHAYDGICSGDVDVSVQLFSGMVSIIVKDSGKGIGDLEKAMEPFYTTKPEQDRSGIGFTLMQTFMTTLEVHSDDEGTIVIMTKSIGGVSA